MSHGCFFGLEILLISYGGRGSRGDHLRYFESTLVPRSLQDFSVCLLPIMPCPTVSAYLYPSMRCPSSWRIFMRAFGRVHGRLISLPAHAII